MYDLSGINSIDKTILLQDIDEMESLYGFKERENAPTYLYHNEKPLIAVWGVGFDDNRNYDLDDVNHILEELKQRGYSDKEISGLEIQVPQGCYYIELSNEFSILEKFVG